MLEKFATVEDFTRMAKAEPHPPTPEPPAALPKPTKSPNPDRGLQAKLRADMAQVAGVFADGAGEYPF